MKRTPCGGLGDLFVVRTAGHVAGAEVLGSIEHGVSVLGCPLVVVLGHDSCAIAAACAAADGGRAPAGFVRDVVERVTKSVLAARAAGHGQAEEILHEHIRHTVDLLLDRSRVLAEGVAAGRLAVAGLSYRLAGGSAQLVASHGLSRAAVSTR
ncbi:carbonic anhydrase [Nonomuraea polychroma]|uniref:carbonic anhydrase n=1 Tax=Nonomuraea polychroma TaxID=46176 RepID=UPI003D8C42B4